MGRNGSLPDSEWYRAPFFPRTIDAKMYTSDIKTNWTVTFRRWYSYSSGNKKWRIYPDNTKGFNKLYISENRNNMMFNISKLQLLRFGKQLLATNLMIILIPYSKNYLFCHYKWQNSVARWYRDVSLVLSMAFRLAIPPHTLENLQWRPPIMIHVPIVKHCEPPIHTNYHI